MAAIGTGATLATLATTRTAAGVYDRDEWADAVRTIRAEPEDDLHRLKAADWLDENGEPERAELIRVQVRLARFPPAPRVLRARSFPMPLTDFLTVTCEVNPDDLPEVGEVVEIEHDDGSRLSGIAVAGFGHQAVGRRAAGTLVEIRLSPVDRPPYAWDERAALRGRERQILGQDAADGWVSLGTAAADEWGTVFGTGLAKVARGFVEEVIAEGREWLELGDLFSRREPIRRVALTTMPRARLHHSTTDDEIHMRLLDRARAWPVPFDVISGTAADVAAHLLAAEWPGVTFDLTAAASTVFPRPTAE